MSDKLQKAAFVLIVLVQNGGEYINIHVDNKVMVPIT